MAVEHREVRVTNEQGLAGLILNAADFLRAEARAGRIFEVASWNVNGNPKTSHFTFREVK